MARKSNVAEVSKPKLRIVRGYAWEQHRHGWAYIEDLVRRHLVCHDGINFVSAVEEQFYKIGPLQEPWVGVVHQVPHHDLPTYPDLARLLEMEAWQVSESHCLGLWTLSDYTRQFLVASGVQVPIGVLPYASPRDVPLFDWDRFIGCARPRLLHIGEYQRDYQAFFDLDVPAWRKQLLEPPKWAIRSKNVRFNESVEIRSPVPEDVYDALLQESVVFLQVVDAPANTTVVECLARATPICINNVGGVAEYLGPDYPLYHDGDAAQLLGDRQRLRDAHDYLLDRRQWVGTEEEFLHRARSSAVYLSLPTPPSQVDGFRRFALTVLIAAYARLPSLPEQLKRLVEQEDAPSFEVVIWNNEPRSAPHIDRIVGNMEGDVPIRVVHSSENIYCAMRFALPAFARSDVILICDDDVLPQPHYVRTLYDAHRRAGPDVAVCLRGHLIRPHRLDFDDPEREWQHEEHMTFLDEAAEEHVVDFAHADNLIISTEILRRAALYPMTHPEYVLVDDYWLSYVISAQLGKTCLKIQAPDIFEFTESANDPEVALYHNPLVHEQRVRLYIEHMRAGWPKTAMVT